MRAAREVPEVFTAGTSTASSGGLSLVRSAERLELTAGSLDERCINVLRGLAMDAVEAAASGHPGMPMGAATMAYVLWDRHLRHAPSDPAWPDRDRFVLSAGHGSMLLYGLLHLTGYDLSLEDLRGFRQWGSRTPGHPEHGMTPGVETTTGPLGQGFGNAVGMAVAERCLAARFNRLGHNVVDHRTFVIASDGDLMEGVQSEAASLAGHLGLGRLLVLYDANGISIDGSTDLAFTENVAARYEAYGWHVLEVDGHDVEAVDGAIHAGLSVSDRPSLVVARTHIGFGSPNKQDSEESHGAPLGGQEVRLAKLRLGLPTEASFWVPEEVREHMGRAVQRGRKLVAEWESRMEAQQECCPGPHAELLAALGDEPPRGWESALPRFVPGKRMSTRKASGQALNAAARRIPWLIGGSADLTGSNESRIDSSGAVRSTDFGARNFHFGVREHAMGAVLNGISLHGGFRPFGGTFLIFSDYMRPSIRLAALMGRPVIYVFTHDSVGLGEDGPTHQPVEQLMSLRLIPGLVVLRPADANETSEAWRVALERRDGPTALVLSRQSLPVVERGGSDGLATVSELSRGGYVLAEGAGDDPPAAVLIGTGSEVHVCLEARGLLQREGIPTRVVSLPSFELFERQPRETREAVLGPPGALRVSVEAGVTRGWERYVGSDGLMVGLDRFGASAPGDRVLAELGFTGEAVAWRVRERLSSL